MRSAVSIDVDAPAALVFELARDVERWPRLLPHYLDVRILDRTGGADAADRVVTARMTAIRAVVPWLGYGLPVTWRARTWAQASERRLRFVHLGGATAGMDVTWRIEPADGGCRVTIEHAFEPGFVPWASFVDRWFVRPIAGRTLATFKAIAEAAQAATPAVPAAPANAAKAAARPASNRRSRAKTST